VHRRDEEDELGFRVAVAPTIILGAAMMRPLSSFAVPTLMFGFLLLGATGRARVHLSSSKYTHLGRQFPPGTKTGFYNFVQFAQNAIPK
jgi:hypothetical protein